jgi:hypothetical protein
MVRKVSDEERRWWEMEADKEQIALSRHPELRALLARFRESARREGTLPTDALRAFRDLTPEDDAEGERLLAELERQTEAETAARLAARSRNGPINGAGRGRDRSAQVGTRKGSDATT